MVLMGAAARESSDQPGGAALPASHRRASLFGDLIALLAVELTNRYVTTNHANAYMFATLFLGVLDPTTGELTYVNAGHDAPTIIGPHGIKARLEPTGPAVGLMPEATFDLGKSLISTLPTVTTRQILFRISAPTFLRDDYCSVLSSAMIG